MLGLFKKKKKPSKLYFALAVADAPLEDATFKADNDCKLFIVAGEMDKREGIPRTTLKEVMERFVNPPEPAKVKKGLEGTLKISEKKV